MDDSTKKLSQELLVSIDYVSDMLNGFGDIAITKSKSLLLFE